MKKAYFLLLIVFSSAVLTNAQNKSSNPQLKDIKKIYVSALGSTDKSDVIREKIKIRLMKTGKFTIVDRKEESDAILTGSVVMENPIDVNYSSVSAKNKGVGVFYLRRTSTDEVIWTYEYKSKLFDFDVFSDKTIHAYNQVAERTVDRLMKDAGYKT